MANKDQNDFKTNIPEEYLEGGSLPWLKIASISVVVIAFIALAAVIWISYTSESETIGSPPVIKATNPTIKIIPDDPGGMIVLYRDKLIYQTIDGSVNEVLYDTLSQSAEIPLKRPQREQSVTEQTDKKVQDHILNNMTNSVSKQFDRTKTDKKKKITTRKNTATTQKTIVPKKAKTITKPAETNSTTSVEKDTTVVTKKTPTVSGDYMFQLGAFSTKKRAKSLWDKLVKANSSQFSDKIMVLEPVDRVNKGTIYRLKGGYFTSSRQANEFCTFLKRQKQGCMVVKNKVK